MRIDWGLTIRRLQYNMLIRVSRGALQNSKAFLARNKLRDDVMSARAPTTKVMYASVRPIMVRNWKCQP